MAAKTEPTLATVVDPIYTSSYHIWAKLERFLVPTFKLQIIQLHGQLHTIRKGSTSITDYIQTINKSTYPQCSKSKWVIYDINYALEVNVQICKTTITLTKGYQNQQKPYFSLFAGTISSTSEKKKKKETKSRHYQ